MTVQRRTLGAREREHDLLRERRLSSARSTGNQIERELRQAATEDLVEPRNACWKPANRHTVGHACVSSEPASAKAPGHAFRNRLAVKCSPTSVMSNPANVANTDPAASMATAGSCRSREKIT